MSTTSAVVAPRIYVGTYAKYNDGSIFGKWFDLSDYSCKEDFLAACAELHRDESVPDFMFQDWVDIPDAFVSESSISEVFWQWLDDIGILSPGEQVAYVDYAEDLYLGEFGLQNFRDAYYGRFESEIDFAVYMAEELEYFSTMENAGINAAYFDLEAFSTDLFKGDFWMSRHGYVFAR